MQLPRDHSDQPFAESQGPAASVALNAPQVYNLVDMDDPKKARFDLFQNVRSAQVRQVVEANTMAVLLAMLRLVSFAYTTVRRRYLGMGMAPLEVLTIAHVFMAICIQAFLWYKPSYLREGINLDLPAVRSVFPDLDAELTAQRLGLRVAYAYTTPSRSGFLPWHRTDDRDFNLRIHANYRALVVFPLCICHAAIFLLPAWGLEFPTPFEMAFWWAALLYVVGLCSIVTILIILDTATRLFADYLPTFGSFWGREDDRQSHLGRIILFRDFVNTALYIVVAPALASLTFTLVLAAMAFRDLPASVRLAGPGDVF